MGTPFVGTPWATTRWATTRVCPYNPIIHIAPLPIFESSFIQSRNDIGEIKNNQGAFKTPIVYKFNHATFLGDHL